MAVILIAAKCGCLVSKKDTSTCNECKDIFCHNHSYYYVDGNNISITKNAKPHCEICYLKVYS